MQLHSILKLVHICPVTAHHIEQLTDNKKCNLISIPNQFLFSLDHFNSWIAIEWNYLKANAIKCMWLVGIARRTFTAVRAQHYGDDTTIVCVCDDTFPFLIYFRFVRVTNPLQSGRYISGVFFFSSFFLNWKYPYRYHNHHIFIIIIIIIIIIITTNNCKANDISYTLFLFLF